MGNGMKRAVAATRLSRSSYVLTKTDKSFCPVCHSNVTLLSDEAMSQKHVPWFYICWTCKKVFQVGRGEVEYEP